MSGLNPSTIARGNVSGHWILSVALTPASVGANTTVEQTFTVPGLLAGDCANVNKPSAQAGLGIVGVRVALNTLAITYVNATASPIVPTAETYTVAIQRPDNLNNGTSVLTQL